MKRFVVASVTAAAFYGASAFAADMPAPVYKAAPTNPDYGWTGFYVGGNVGFGVAKDPSTNNPTGGGFQIHESFNLSPQGVLGGGQIGYNWQVAPNWVWGIEADIQASAQADSTTCIDFCSPTIFAQVSQKLPWFGTLRGRFGWTNGPTLFYATGGLAYGGVTTDFTVNLGGGTDHRSLNHTILGSTIGGGVETQLAGNWTAKVEYLFVNLGNVNNSFVYAFNPAVTLAESSSIRNHVVRVGLNYKFGDPIFAPTAHTSGFYKAPPALAPNWSGIYLGGNVGYGVARDPSVSAQSSPTFNTVETFNLNPQGVLGGGQIGYNWQAAPNWVWGIETDIQASAQKDSTTCVTICNVVSRTQVSEKLPWFGTLRARLGWTNGPSLYYVTGGLAYGGVTTDYVFNTNGAGIDQHHLSRTKAGPTIGGGIETKLAGNWTAKVEYLYVDLGNFTNSIIYTPTPGTSYAESSATHDHVVRVGLNYKFGSQ
jgi:outer membrane immunogenic protein